jgi:NAD-dependent dihydropyrimidine dehydrogenase PreA subunit
MAVINTEVCVVCGGCIDLCPTTAIRMIDDNVNIDTEKCVDCGICVKVCPLNAPYVPDEDPNE